MDKILLEGIRFEIRVGTTEEERNQPQLCGLDLSLETDLKRAGESGDLDQTLDYAAVFRTVEKLCGQRSFTLLEELGEQLCQELFASYSVKRVRVKIRKLNPFTVKLGSVGIELKRYRKQYKK